MAVARLPVETVVAEAQAWRPAESLMAAGAVMAARGASPALFCPSPAGVEAEAQAGADRWLICRTQRRI